MLYIQESAQVFRTHVSITEVFYFFLSLAMAVQPFGPWPLLQFLNPIRSR
jgi:hypothetical protein